MKHLFDSMIRYLALVLLFVIISITTHGQGLRIYKNDGTTQVLPYASFDSIVGYDVPIISIESDDTIYVPTEGLKDKIKIKTNMAWTLKKIPSWIKFTPQQGVGNTMVEITVNANNSWERKTMLMFECDDQFTSSTIIIVQDGKKHEYVDLGLSVKWATCNVGASVPEDYGSYFAWGETSTKGDFSWDSYRFRSGGQYYYNVVFSKYNTDSISGVIDNRITLELADDVAHAIWGGNWRMPTLEECKELIDSCTWSHTSLNGVDGYVVYSNITGYTNNYIFLPAAGGLGVNYPPRIGYGAFYWSSMLVPSYTYLARGLSFYIDNRIHMENAYRCNGYPVRPVCK